jgi:hypothetical protein
MKRDTMRRLLAAVLAIVLIIAIPTGKAEAKTSKTTVAAGTIEAGKQFTLNNIPYNGRDTIISSYQGQKLRLSTVQNFAYTPDGKYIFTTAECKSGGKLHTLLCRCAVPEAKGPDAKAECLEAIVLGKFGHGEAIDITQEDLTKETYNLWVATTPGSEKYGIEIARITMTVGASKTTIDKMVTIKDFKKANVVKGKAAFFDKKPTPRRLNVAIDEDNNQIMFRVQFPSGKGVNYVAYDYEKLNDALDKLANGKKFSITKAAKWQKANLRTSLVPANSFQSFQICDNTLYVCGGHMNKGAQIYAIKYKTYANGKKVKQEVKQNKSQISRIISLETVLNIKGNTYTNAKLEVEGMKLYKNDAGKLDVYVNFYIDAVGMLRDGISIYKFEI